MLRLIDGFDHYNTRAMMLRKWDAVANANVLGTAYGRFGTQGVSLQEGDYSILGQGSLAKNLPATNTGWGFFGAAFQFPTIPTGFQYVLFAVYDIAFGTAMHCCVALMADGSLAVGSVVINNFSRGFNVVDQTEPGLITATSTRYIEAGFKIGVGGGVIVRIDGQEVLNYSGDTRLGAGAGSGITISSNSQFTHLKIGGGLDDGGCRPSVDDFYYCDDTGTTNDDFLGDVRVHTLWPEDVGASSDFVRNGGTAAGNYTAVDELSPDDDASFVDTDVPGAEDFYEMQDVSGDTIFGVAVTSCARAADESAGTIQNEILANGVTGTGPSKTLSTSYTFIQTIFETNPDTLAQWTAEEVSDAQAGIKFVG